MALGLYPEISLKAAREAREAARGHLAQGVDPGEVKKAQRQGKDGNPVDFFENVAREWFSKHERSWAKSHSIKVRGRLVLNVFPMIGSERIGELKAPEVLEMLRRIEERGANETAHRVKGICGQVFRYVIATGQAERDPTVDLRGALVPGRVSILLRSLIR